MSTHFEQIFFGGGVGVILGFDCNLCIFISEDD